MTEKALSPPYWGKKKSGWINFVCFLQPVASRMHESFFFTYIHEKKSRILASRWAWECFFFGFLRLRNSCRYFLRQSQSFFLELMKGETVRGVARICETSREHRSFARKKTRENGEENHDRCFSLSMAQCGINIFIFSSFLSSLSKSVLRTRTTLKIHAHARVAH